MIDKPRMICIDPGHGGVDSGAVNSNLGIYEKTINLAVALAMTESLPARFDYGITRSDDFYETLKARVEMSNNWETDLFISLHANWYIDPKVRGLETYYCEGSEKGHKAAIAVMNELIKTVDVLNGNIDVIDRGEKPGAYYVLKNTQAPAILVELGFVSNDWQAEFMSNVENQAAMSRAIWRGVKTYFAAIDG